MTDAVTVRRLTRDDAWPASVPPEDRVPAVHVVVAERGTATVGVGLLDERGSRLDPGHSDHPDHPDHPADPVIRLVEHQDRDGVLAVVAALQADARERGANRITMGWDPMDAPGLKALARLGFRPTGTMPYFDLGGGEVQYVNGYMDATGSTLDLAWAAE